MQNKLYFLDDIAFKCLLPVGSVQIANEEANTIQQTEQVLTSPLPPNPINVLLSTLLAKGIISQSDIDSIKQNAKI